MRYAYNIPLHDGYIGYYALALCILRNCVSEQALGLVETGETVRLTEKDSEDMLWLKEQALYYRQIGEMYGITHEAVYGRIKKLKKIRQGAKP